ncbi:MAG TPA: hypothetical protein VMS56_14585 [Thermoanaerobaculia bacterium]|nr:hypothetical protein [Thermoanaerobaculia bacterium]
MRSRPPKWLAAAALSTLLSGACIHEPPQPVDEEVTPSLGELTEIPVPALAPAGEPHLEASPGGALLMSWIERSADDDRASVRLARYEEGSWTDPVTVASGNDLFVNWADFPSVHAFDDGSLAAHWLQKSGPGVYAYDVRIARSVDGGASWSEPLTPHRDGTSTEHGFVSLGHREGSTDLEAVWLDGRNMAGTHDGHAGGDMTLRWARIDTEGVIVEEAELDPRVCECCQTSLAMLPSGPLVAYRDRSADEIRDVALVRRTAEGWSEPRLVHDDGWRIEGCPVNGPQVDALGSDAVVAWFSGAGGTLRTSVAFTSDGGASWSAPIAIDGGRPLGRVDVLLLEPDKAVVTWLERGDEGAEIRTRVVGTDGRAGPAVRVGGSSPARAAGFPRTARLGDRVFYAWTDPTEPPRILLRAANLEE